LKMVIGSINTLQGVLIENKKPKEILKEIKWVFSSFQNVFIYLIIREYKFS
jgi:hypothetical protein